MPRARTWKRIRGASPRAQGFAWPAEWSRHEATILAWPHDPKTWPGCVPEAEQVFATFITAIGTGETVHVLVRDEGIEARAREHLAAAGASKRVRLHRVPTADSWLRDTGPIVVARGRGAGRERLALDFRFNAWGEKYESLMADDDLPPRLRKLHRIPGRRIDLVLEGGSIDGDGQGTVLTTEQCLLHTNRNPDLTRAEIEWHLREALGAKTILWLGAGIEGDDTDGHVDDITRFVAPGVVVTVVEDDPQDPNHAPLDDNLRRLRAMEDARGRALEVIPLPMPRPILGGDGRPLPASHANFLIANRVVCVPTFGQPSDAVACKRLARLFPSRRIVPIRCERFVEGMGALHCVSQQIPA
jgi:agmatine deiminase